MTSQGRQYPDGPPGPPPGWPTRGDYTPIRHLLDEADGYHIVIGLKNRIKDQLRRAYALGFFHGGDDEAAKPPSPSPPDDPHRSGA